MTFNIKNNRLLHCFFFSMAIALISLVFCLFKLKSIAVEEFRSDNERYEAYLIANRLRQSSDDLTHLARLYVNTNEKKYQDYYYQALNIRNGTTARPIYYDMMYWDLVIANNKQGPFGPKKSIVKMLLEQYFPLSEFLLLLEAENKSNLLSETEIQAINTVNGLYMDDYGRYTIKGTPNPQAAQRMLFNDEYVQKKAAVVEPLKKFFDLLDERTLAKNESLNKEMTQIIFIAIFLAILSTIIMLISIFQALTTLSKVNKENDLLLLNVLPEKIAIRLKSGEQDIADEYPQASVMFADIINFTELTEKYGPKKIVRILNLLFTELDNLIETYHIEKVKTIGDNYMVVSGVPVQNTEHAKNLANYALAVLEKMKAFNKTNQLSIQLRIGMTYGSVIAGVIGHKKFVYDVWGNVVNLASRLEKTSLSNKIHVSEKMAFMLEDEFILESRETQTIKGIGKIKTYFLIGKKPINPNHF